MSKRTNDFTFSDIKANILGFSGNLLVATNSAWKSPYVVVYTISSKDFKADADIGYNVFGRVCANTAFKADKQCINTLARFYSEYLTEYVISVSDLEKIALENNTNLGKAMEIFLVNTGDFKFGSKKQDNRKIDLISTKTGKLYQLKTSVVKAGSHGSAGTTNGRATKK